jgi:hypothetical protein
MKGIMHNDREKGWIIKFGDSELPLHPEDVSQINEWDRIFDNIEARILSQPECDFEIVTGLDNNESNVFHEYAKIIYT